MGSRRTIAITLATAFVLLGSAAHAAPDGCTPITSVPMTIATRGVYCLTGNLSTDVTQGAAITVTVSSVVIDFEGYRLRNSLGSPLGGIGIEVNAANVVIRNGLISNFGGIGSVGIRINARGTIVEDMRFSDNTHAVSIDAEAEEAVIRRNYCRLNSACIAVWGNAAHVVENDIAGETGTPDADNNGAGVNIYGLNALVVGNRLTRLDEGIYFGGTATGKYRGNLTTNVTTPYTGGTDAGNND